MLIFIEKFLNFKDLLNMSIIGTLSSLKILLYHPAHALVCILFYEEPIQQFFFQSELTEDFSAVKSIGLMDFECKYKFLFEFLLIYKQDSNLNLLI